MLSTPATYFNDLFPELFLVISYHLPLAYRPSTLLSLALTCRQICEIVIPHLLYKAVRLVDDQALLALKTLNAKAQAVTEEDIQQQGNPSPSHCIHHLCIDATLATPLATKTSDHCLNALHKLIDIDGLPNLTSLTLHTRSHWDGVELEDFTDAFLIMPSSFWQSLKSKCPNLKHIHMTEMSQKFGDEWIERELFSSKDLSSIRLAGYLHNYELPAINFSQLPPSLHTLELRLSAQGNDIDASGPCGLLNYVIPNLRTLILDRFVVSDPTITKRFWKAHQGIERLELRHYAEGHWFDEFESGMLPNLKYLKCGVISALALIPHVSASLVSFCLLETYNAQAPYILRKVALDGKLPALRSLGIHLEAGNSPKPRPGHRWREDENGIDTEADFKKPRRDFDGNYIMSITKAAPNLEELELIGRSNDTIDSIVASLSRLPKLRRLTLSGAINGRYKPFFPQSYDWEEYENYHVSGLEPKDYGKYAPESFEDAVRDLANGCQTLDTVTVGNAIDDFLIRHGLSMRVVRERQGGAVKELKRVRAWGGIIGREDEWQ